MIVDDSAVIRGGLKHILEEDPQIEITGSAQNGELAIKEAERKKPDIIILDVEMPVMDGLTALPKILDVSPNSKVIMFSALTEKGADTSIRAMALGAVECLLKPSAGSAKKGSPFQQDLLRLVKNLSGKTQPATRINERGPAAAPSPLSTPLKTEQDAPPRPNIAASGEFQLLKDPKAFTGKPSVLAIGSSTGGPQALFATLSHLKDVNIPVVITQHMPATFTKILADHIQTQCGIPAHEGEDGMPLQKGHIYVAPGGKHMLIQGSTFNPVIALNDGPAENFCKPAVDPMFRSLVDIYGSRIMAVILTGMGHDGLKGGQAITEAKGRLIAQDKSTSVVWGMPGAVAMAGICREVLPLPDIGPYLKQTL